MDRSTSFEIIEKLKRMDKIEFQIFCEILEDKEPVLAKSIQDEINSHRMFKEAIANKEVVNV